MIKEKFLKNIKELTETNNHTKARITIAKEMKKLGFAYGMMFEEMFLAILKTENNFGYLPTEISILRNDLTNKMLEEISLKFGLKFYNDLKKCL